MKCIEENDGSAIILCLDHVKEFNSVELIIDSKF